MKGLFMCTVPYQLGWNCFVGGRSTAFHQGPITYRLGWDGFIDGRGTAAHYFFFTMVYRFGTEEVGGWATPEIQEIWGDTTKL